MPSADAAPRAARGPPQAMEGRQRSRSRGVAPVAGGTTADTVAAPVAPASATAVWAIQLHVSALAGPLCDVVVRHDGRVREAKAAIEAASGIPIGQQILLLDGRELESKESLLAAVDDQEVVSLTLLRRPWLETVLLGEGRALRRAPEEVRRDRDLVLAAVQRDGLELEFAAPALQEDRELVLAAVRQNGRALRFAATALRKDHDVVLAAVNSCGLALMYAEESLKRHPVIFDVALATYSEHKEQQPAQGSC